MRNIAEIVKDDRNGKELSQTERRVATAYIQGKYDAVRELKINNNSNTNELLEKISAEIEWLKLHRAQYVTNDNKVCIDSQAVLDIVYKYKVRNKYEPGINSNTIEVLNKVRAAIEKEEKWLSQAGYNAYNVDIAFSAIKSVLAESEVEE